MESAVQWLDARALEVSKWNKFDVEGRERYGRDMLPPPYHRVCYTTSTEDVGGPSLLPEWRYRIYRHQWQSHVNSHMSTTGSSSSRSVVYTGCYDTTATCTGDELVSLGGPEGLQVT